MQRTDSEFSEKTDKVEDKDKKKKIETVAKAFNKLVKGATAVSLGLGVGSAAYIGAKAVHEYVDSHDISNFPGDIRTDIMNRENNFIVVTRDSYGGYTVNQLTLNYIPGQPIELSVYPKFYDKDGKPPQISSFVGPQVEKFDNLEELRQRISELTEDGIVYMPLPFKNGPRS